MVSTKCIGNQDNGPEDVQPKKIETYSSDILQELFLEHGLEREKEYTDEYQECQVLDKIVSIKSAFFHILAVLESPNKNPIDHKNVLKHDIHNIQVDSIFSIRHSKHRKKILYFIYHINNTNHKKNQKHCEIKNF